MNDTRDALIASLAADAQPVERPGRTGRMALAWLAAAAVLAIAGLLLHAPATVFRGPLLLTSPQFLLESALGAAALICAGMAAFRAGIPAPPSRRAVWLPLLPLLAWLALHVAELWFPTFEASMAGKRAHCWLEVLVVGVPGLVLGGYLVRRRLWPLRARRTGALLGLASGAIPALAMQFICIHEPQHILAFHLAPMAVLGMVGAMIGARLLRAPSPQR
jgi:hypothetical protein